MDRFLGLFFNVVFHSNLLKSCGWWLHFISLTKTYFSANTWDLKYCTGKYQVDKKFTYSCTLLKQYNKCTWRLLVIYCLRNPPAITSKKSGKFAIYNKIYSISHFPISAIHNFFSITMLQTLFYYQGNKKDILTSREERNSQIWNNWICATTGLLESHLPGEKVISIMCCYSTYELHLHRIPWYYYYLFILIVKMVHCYR